MGHIATILIPIIALFILLWPLFNGRNVSLSEKISLGFLLCLFFVFLETEPLKGKLDHVYYKGRKYKITMVEYKANGEVLLELDCKYKVRPDSVTSAKPRTVLSDINDLRTKYKF
jgi:hypothetical protein